MTPGQSQYTDSDLTSLFIVLPHWNVMFQAHIMTHTRSQYTDTELTSLYSAASLECYVPGTGHDTTTPVTVYWHRADQSALSIYLQVIQFKVLSLTRSKWWPRSTTHGTVLVPLYHCFWIRLTTQTIHSLVASLMRLILSAKITSGKIYCSTTTSTSSVFNRTLSHWICGRLVCLALYAEDTRFESSMYWFQ